MVGFIQDTPSPLDPTGIRACTALLRSHCVIMIEISVLYPLLFGLLIFALVRKWKRPSLPYPPGPKGYPILGNVLDLTAGVPLWEDVTSLTNRHGTPRGRFIRDRSETAL